MDEVLKEGTIECDCGNVFYYRSIFDEIKCMKCGKTYPNSGTVYVPPEEPPTEG